MTKTIRPGFLADALTATRLALTVPLFFAAGTDWLEPVAVIVTLAWWTDVFDGRLARLAPGNTRLGSWGPFADAAIGSALLAGLIVAGTPVVWGLVGVALLVAFVRTTNPAWCMLLQAVAYAVFMSRLTMDTAGWLIPPVVTAMAILVINRDRLFGERLPFASGVAEFHIPN